MLWRRIGLAAGFAALVLGSAFPAMAQSSDGAAPGATLGPGDEGVGALVRTPPAAPGPLASSTTTDSAAPQSPASATPQAGGATAQAAAKAEHHARPPRRTPAQLRKLRR